MASEKQIKGESETAGNEQAHIEKERVPKMTSHFESLADQARESHPEKSTKEKAPHGETESLSTEEIGKYRQIAQQNSIEAINAAEESTASAIQGIKESAQHRLGAITSYVADKGGEAKDTAVERARVTAQYAAEKCGAVKNTALEKAQYTKDLALQKAAEAKEKAPAVGWGAAHYTSEKAVEATKAIEGVAELAGEKVKEAAAAGGESVKEYTARKKAEAEAAAMAMKEEQAKESSQMKKESGEQEQNRATEESKQEPQHGTIEQGTKENVGGILGAIGETVIEIAQTAKGLVVSGGGESVQQKAKDVGQGQHTSEGQEKMGSGHELK